jgi:hypothetical protein
MSAAAIAWLGKTTISTIALFHEAPIAPRA